MKKSEPGLLELPNNYLYAILILIGIYYIGKYPSFMDFVFFAAIILSILYFVKKVK